LLLLYVGCIWICIIWNAYVLDLYGLIQDNMIIYVYMYALNCVYVCMNSIKWHDHEMNGYTYWCMVCEYVKWDHGL